MAFNAVILAGGTAVRLGGVDKASVEVGGRTLLSRALDAVIDASEVVVVGDPVRTERPVTFTREEPRHGGPAAGLLTGRDAMHSDPPTLAVLACDMPQVTAQTFRRLHEAMEGHDGAILVDPSGRRQLAFVVSLDRLDAVAPELDQRHNLAIHRLLSRLDLAEVPSVDDEHCDVDTWDDLRDLGP